MSALCRNTLALMLMAASGCATYATVKRLQPAEIRVRKGDRVAVSALGGTDGSNLRSQLGQSITQVGFLQLVDRTHLDAILAEQRRIMQGVAREDGVRVGDLAAAAFMINGQASAQLRTTRQRENDVCSSYDARLKKTVQRPCVAQVALMTVEYVAELSFVDTSTGEVKAKRAFRKSRQASNKSHEGAPVMPPSEPLVDACRSEVVEEFRKVISPFEVREQVKLVSDGQLPQLEAGNKFALAGDWQKAAQFYGQAAQLVSGGAVAVGVPRVQAKAYYALGLALAMQGDYTRGLEFLNRASGLDPNDDSIALIMRVNRWAKDSALVDLSHGDAPRAEP